MRVGASQDVVAVAHEEHGPSVDMIDADAAEDPVALVREPHRSQVADRLGEGDPLRLVNVGQYGRVVDDERRPGRSLGGHAS